MTLYTQCICRYSFTFYFKSRVLTSVAGYGIHFLFRKSFPDFTIVKVYYVEFLSCKEMKIQNLQSHNTLFNQYFPTKLPQIHTNDFVHSVMVIKGDKAESSLLSCGAFLHDVDSFDLPVFLKIIPNVVLLRVLLDATNKNLLDCQMGSWFVGVLKQSGSVNTSPTTTQLYLRLMFLPLWTQLSLVQQHVHLLYEALRSWHHQLRLQKSTWQNQNPWTVCCWDPSSPRKKPQRHQE